MPQWKEITKIEEWNQCLGDSLNQPVLVVKHSTTCPISAAAWKECNEYLNGSPRENTRYILVKVIESRPVSNQIAEDLNVKHESPQAIFIMNKMVKWNASHWKITNQTLQEALGN